MQLSDQYTAVRNARRLIIPGMCVDGDGAYAVNAAHAALQYGITELITNELLHCWFRSLYIRCSWSRIESLSHRIHPLDVLCTMAQWERSETRSESFALSPHRVQHLQSVTAK